MTNFSNLINRLDSISNFSVTQDAWNAFTDDLKDKWDDAKNYVQRDAFVKKHNLNVNNINDSVRNLAIHNGTFNPKDAEKYMKQINSFLFSDLTTFPPSSPGTYRKEIANELEKLAEGIRNRSYMSLSDVQKLKGRTLGPAVAHLTPHERIKVKQILLELIKEIS